MSRESFYKTLNNLFEIHFEQNEDGTVLKIGYIWVLIAIVELIKLLVGLVIYIVNLL